MADNYLEFSEVLPRLAAEEEQWLQQQLKTVCVFGEQEYPEDKIPEDLLGAADPDWQGCRAYRNVPECAEYVKEMDLFGPGFEYRFCSDEDTDGLGRYLWFGTDEGGYLEGLAHLVQKFLKRFRPDQCWSLTYANTCSKPRIGEFGGGAVFVTAQEIRWQDAYDFVAEQRATFEAQTRNGADRRADDAQEAVPEDQRCAHSPTGGHVPDPRSIQPADGAGRNRGTDWLIDVNCLHCGRSGSMWIDPSKLQW
jgi:hypothetical protein